jgi:hypothetical protein
MEELYVQGDLTYTEYPIKIIATLTRVIRNKVIKCPKCNGVIMEMMKLLGREKKSYEQNFPTSSLVPLNLEVEIIFMGGRICNTQFVKNKRRFDIIICFVL